jgi:hypothetical protein
LDLCAWQGKTPGQSGSRIILCDAGSWFRHEGGAREVARVSVCINCMALTFANGTAETLAVSMIGRQPIVT